MLDKHCQAWVTLLFAVIVMFMNEQQGTSRKKKINFVELYIRCSESVTVTSIVCDNAMEKMDKFVNS